MEPKLSPRQIMNRIYKGVCGFEIPKADEKQVRKSKGSPLYGEIGHEALNRLLSYLDLSPQDIFFDLGSGVGKVVLHTALFTPVKKAVGIELSQMRYDEAQEALSKAKAMRSDIKRRCEFYNDDLMHADLSKATVIYTCSTAFSLEFMRSVTKRLSQFEHDFRLVTLQDLPSEKHFSLLKTLRLDMSWIRKTPVYIYRRNSPSA